MSAMVSSKIGEKQVNTVAWRYLTETVTAEWTAVGVEGGGSALRRRERRPLVYASVKALRRVPAWDVPGMARTPVWLGQRELGDSSRKWGQRSNGNQIVRPLDHCRLWFLVRKTVSRGVTSIWITWEQDHPGCWVKNELKGDNDRDAQSH